MISMKPQTAPCADCPEIYGERYEILGGLKVCWPCLLRRNPHFTDTAEPINGHAAAPLSRVVVLPGPKGPEHHHNPRSDRYQGRQVDVADLLSRPPQPIPWRVHDLVADGTLTIISGESGSGKSWLAQALCIGVAHGRTTAGLLCAKGKALYVDGEMGSTMFVDQRIRPTGATSADFGLIDAMGLDFSTEKDLAWLRAQIVDTGANLAVIDSHRRLAPSKAENDSDDMAPVVAAYAKLARDTSAAIVLVHHKGDGEKFWRGSTAIRDQADALFGLLRDDEDGDVRRLSCGKGKGKMRYAVEPADRFLVISPEAGGVAACDPPERTGDNSTPVLNMVKAQILAALPEATKAAVAKKIGRTRDNSTFREAWDELYASETIAAVDGRWVVVVVQPPSGAHHHHHTATLTLIEGDGGVA